MSVSQHLHQDALSLPKLTHQRVQELKQTGKGQRIIQEPFATLPFLVKSLTRIFEGKLHLFERARATNSACPEGITTDSLVEDYEFLEFVQFIMFTKWTEEQGASHTEIAYGQLRAS
ncbi:hypothetical protein [Chitinophaga sp. Cy-1792]|uniref:hypothetical protein n=1 Tax=Chitinophaga sp. Cy-1792 TaxID=2608339 RepID=UPI001421B2D6|nr:hypothetical protein [Chitinophaga sp. Cy-1792]NIG54895.1 hypothetical protein [Chitinophaga sp. Cy-1792]